MSGLIALKYSCMCSCEAFHIKSIKHPGALHFTNGDIIKNQNSSGLATAEVLLINNISMNGFTLIPSNSFIIHYFHLVPPFSIGVNS